MEVNGSGKHSSLLNTATITEFIKSSPSSVCHLRNIILGDIFSNLNSGQYYNYITAVSYAFYKLNCCILWMQAICDGATTLSIMTFSITTLSITTLSTTTLCIEALCAKLSISYR